MTPEHLLNVFEQQVKEIKSASNDYFYKRREAKAWGVYRFLQKAGFQQSKLEEIWDKYMV